MVVSNDEAREGPAPILNIAIDPPVDGVSVVRVAGELDLMTAPLLRDALFDPSRCPGPDLRLDLRQVDFIDSVSVGTLVAAHRLATERGGSVSLLCARGLVSRVLSITKLDTVFAVEVDEGATTGATVPAAD